MTVGSWSEWRATGRRPSLKSRRQPTKPAEVPTRLLSLSLSLSSPLCNKMGSINQGMDFHDRVTSRAHYVTNVWQLTKYKVKQVFEHIIDYCDAHLCLDAAQVGEFARVEGPQRPARLPRDALPAVHPQEAVPVVPAERERDSVNGRPQKSGVFVWQTVRSHLAVGSNIRCNHPEPPTDK